MCSHETEAISVEDALERDFPGIKAVRTVGSRSRTKDIPRNLENDFFIMFKFETDYPSEKAWRSFYYLVQSITGSDWNKRNTIDAWVRIEVEVVEDEVTGWADLLFTIHGHNVPPHTVVGWFDVTGSDPA